MASTRGPVSFADAAEFRAWLERHHATATELDVRLWKTHAKHRGMGYKEALDEALCFGWIDGVRRSVDADSFRIRFTPRKKGSYWSDVNVRHVDLLEKAGRMHAAGRTRTLRAAIRSSRSRSPCLPRSPGNSGQRPGPGVTSRRCRRGTAGSRRTGS